MNFDLPFIPERTARPRSHGLTMVMDKGLSLSEAASFVEVNGELTDIVKLGFGTSYLTRHLKEKIALYHQAGMKVYLGGTLFEAFVVRDMFEDYQRLLDDLGLETVEVSDGSIHLEHDAKLEYIHRLSQNRTVLSEVGSKEEGILIAPAKWVKMMDTELQAGSWKVIAEARESGNVGIYRPNGTAHVVLVNKILDKVKAENILWESPQKAQQVWFIRHSGANVNLGNIQPEEVIPLETLRLGLRADTLFEFVEQRTPALDTPQATNGDGEHR